MQTRFSSDQLSDPILAEANEILRSCVHCGFCNATCPTYSLAGDERDGPRGRIYLIKDMLEQDRAPSQTDVTHIDRCLSCLACMTTCPSGVNYMHLVDHARSHIERNWRRPLLDRLMRKLLGAVLPNPLRASGMMALARIAHPLAKMFPRRIRRMIEMTPAPDYDSKVLTPILHPAEGKTLYRVALLQGCVQQAIGARINTATIRLLARHGCDVIVPWQADCCGALNLHLGQDERARAAAGTTIRAFMAAAEEGELDAVIINASGCGTMIKDYGYLFRDDAELSAPAEEIATLARDVCEFMATIGIKDPDIKGGIRVAYQSACSLQHGQKITTQPVELLRSCSFEVKEPKGAHLCCGSAGTYNILQGDIADTLRDNKLAALKRLRPDIIASGNIGCMTQLEGNAPCPVVHTVELLDWATGGPVPPKILSHGNNRK
jgi:glycolate oxidase iron-sulfur subunit